ncbi:MAG: DUF2905 domain-containing protein [Gammaproteobacteria bacterium]|nr:DUF2905 domain-containing protein [Gammaproteobacteria bacterium]MCG3144469.1 hypothetical protein [Gammaproteobacteria bacterium]
MPDLPPVSRILVVAGALLIVIGLLWPVVARLGLGRLPGDIVIEREGMRIHLPLVTGLILSAILSVLLWFFRR